MWFDLFGLVVDCYSSIFPDHLRLFNRNWAGVNDANRGQRVTVCKRNPYHRLLSWIIFHTILWIPLKYESMFATLYTQQHRFSNHSGHLSCCTALAMPSLIASFMGANIGPIWGRRDSGELCYLDVVIATSQTCCYPWILEMEFLLNPNYEFMKLCKIHPIVF